MSIARGSRSALLWKEETTYGVAPGGNWNSFPVNTDAMTESISTVQGEDIRPDRASPGLRGGNITTGGNVVADYGPVRQLTFLKHLLAASVVSVPLTGNVANAVDSVAYAVGDWVKGSTNTLWQCTVAGTASTGLVAALTGTSNVVSGTATFAPRKGAAAAADSTAYGLYDIVTGPNGTRWQAIAAGTTSTGVTAALTNTTADVVSGTVTFRYLVGNLLPNVAYKRGDVAIDATGRFWTCSRGGTTGAGVTTGSLTGVGEVIVTGTASTTLKFSYFGVSTSNLFKHYLRAGAAWPTGGISIEKQIKGGNSDLFVLFTGCRINSMELAVQQEGITKSTLNILSKESLKLGATGAGTPVLVGEAPFTGFNCYVGLNDTVGNADRAVREFNMTITNQADENAFVIGSRFRADIPEGIRRSSGRLSMYFQDHQEYDWFKNEVTIAMMASFVWNGRMVSYNFPEVKLTGTGTPNITGPGLLQADFEWTAFLESAAYDVEVVALNDTPKLAT